MSSVGCFFAQIVYCSQCILFKKLPLVYRLSSTVSDYNNYNVSLTCGNFCEISSTYVLNLEITRTYAQHQQLCY